MTTPTGSFEKSSIQWHFQQMGRWMQEWFELQFVDPPDLPTGASPDWFLETIFWIVAAAIATWLLWQLALLLRSLWQNLQDSQQGTATQRTAVQDSLSVSAWLRQAQTFQRQGNYAQACRALYMAMLQRLDDTKLLPQQVSRTDGEYFELVQTLAKSQPCQTLITTHERVCFDNAAVSLDTFEQCQRAYREIEAP